LARNIHASHSKAEVVAEAAVVAALAGMCIGDACASGNTNILRRRRGKIFIL
jgi:hypothetical protein